MTCQQITIILLAYRSLMLKILSEQEHADLSLDVISQYSFVTIEIKKSHQFFCQVRFEVTDNEGKLLSFYCEDDSLQSILTTKIESKNWPGWTSTSSIDLPYSQHVLSSMEIADSIAALSKNCTRGDEYRPGNFSKVMLDSNLIKLEQINHMNAKSLNHKNNYSLRSLVFTIPLEGNLANENGLHDYKIGIMTATFSDSSSRNNKSCGDKIVAELKRLGAD